MKKHLSPSKLRICRETLTSLAATPLERAAGAARTWDFYCTNVCSFDISCVIECFPIPQTTTCP